MTEPFATVFTITYQQRDKVLELARDLAAQDYPPDRFEFVVLDDGGTDGTADTLEQEAARLPYHMQVLRRVHDGDYLNARRWNECIERACRQSEFFIQVDDVRLRPDFITRHSAWHANNGLVLVTGAKFEGDEPTWELRNCRRASLAGPDGQPREVPWTACWGASMSYSRNLTELLSTSAAEQPFDSDMTGWGFHEVEFACRAARAGVRIIYDPAVGVFHQNHTPSESKRRGVDHSAHKATGTVKNEEYVLSKHKLSELPRW